MNRHEPAISKHPFTRIVKDMCQSYGLNFRWHASALDCLHEAAEDFMVEFFQDAYILAAHAHRVTVMPRDFTSLKLLRFRYDKLLEPQGIVDRKMKGILEIPPLKKSREVKVTDVTRSHAHNTRLNAQKIAQDRGEAQEIEARETADLEAKAREAEAREAEAREAEAAEKRERHVSLHEDNYEALEMLGPVFDIVLPLRRPRQEHLSAIRLSEEDILILSDLRREVNDRVMMAVLRYCKTLKILHVFLICIYGLKLTIYSLV